MDLKNPKEIREKIINFVKSNGPSLPIQVARASGLDMTFASAFLSELAAEKIIKISNMKVGTSPLYLLYGQEEMLEKFYTYLNQKEREAFLMLKEARILEDDKLEPAIRVALRAIKDFAFPLVPNLPEKIIFWKFHSLSLEQASDIIENMLKNRPIKVSQTQEVVEEIKIKKEEVKSEEKVNVSEKQEVKIEKQEVKSEEQPKIEGKPEVRSENIKRKAMPEDFLNEVKTWIEARKIELIRTEDYDKKEVILRVKINNEECLLFAFNKKKITEKEMIKSYKKSLPLQYIILLKDNIPKKLKESIDAAKNLKSAEKL